MHTWTDSNLSRANQGFGSLFAVLNRDHVFALRAKGTAEATVVWLSTAASERDWVGFNIPYANDLAVASRAGLLVVAVAQPPAPMSPRVDLYDISALLPR